MQVRMGVVRDAAISVLLVLLTVVTFTAADSLDPSVCRTPTCFCANVTGQALPDTFHVTCFVQSFSKSDRTMQKLTPDLTSLKLVCSESSTPNHLTSATFSGVPELRRLGLENCHLAAVSHDALDSLPGLQELHIQRCVFSQLPADVLSRTVKLSRLTLAHCALQDLPRLCSLQGSLELLNVSGQSLTSLDRCVEGCHSDDTEFRRLIVMDVSNNSLSRLPHAMLSKAANLRELHVQHNRISRLNFTGCTRLEILNTLGQKLEYADLTGDGCLLSFKVLQLEGNGSALFSIDDLQRMTDLTQLHLENMAVGDPIWEVLPFLRNLSHLSLPANNLTGLNLSREVSLRHLNVSRNAVLSLESDTLAWQTRLEVLDLSWNNLTSLMSGSFVSLSSLTTLDLRHNRLRLVLQAAFRNLSGLRSLSLDANRLDTLPYFLLRETPALQELSVSGNTLTSLPSLKNAAHLVLVNARYNRISWVPALSDVPQLEYLFMRGNRLRLVRSAAFLGAPLLAILELSENNITSVDSFQHHPGLKWVQLDHNKIQDLSGVFRDLPQLGSVFADYNLLVRLTSDYFPASLHTLVVHFNQLSYVEPRMFVAMTRLRVVQLNANFNLYRLPRESRQLRAL